MTSSISMTFLSDGSSTQQMYHDFSDWISMLWYHWLRIPSQLELIQPGQLTAGMSRVWRGRKESKEEFLVGIVPPGPKLVLSYLPVPCPCPPLPVSWPRTNSITLQCQSRIIAHKRENTSDCLREESKYSKILKCLKLPSQSDAVVAGKTATKNFEGTSLGQSWAENLISRVCNFIFLLDTPSGDVPTLSILFDKSDSLHGEEFLPREKHILSIAKEIQVLIL